MNPYPGESIGLYDAARVVGGTGYSIAQDITYRGTTGGAGNGYATLSGGDEWRAWALGYGTYQDDDTIDASFSWVVEVLSGSVTFTAAEGLDPAYGDTTLAPTRALGTFTAGPGTTVIPSGFTVAEGWADTAAFMLVLEAVSGSADVQQVKLRLWPTAGVAGGWSDVKPSWAGEWGAPDIRHQGFSADGEHTATSPETSWVLAWDAAGLDPAAPGPHEFDFTTPFLDTYVDQVAPNLTDYFTRVSAKADLALIQGKDWTTYLGIDEGAFVEGVDWIRPPTEVDGDRAYYLQQVGAGGIDWRNALAVIRINATAHPLGGVHLFSEAFDTLATTPGTNPGSVVADIPLTAGLRVATAAPADVEETEPLPTDGVWLAVSITHSTMLDTGEVIGWPGTTPGFLSTIEHQCFVTVDFGTVAGDPIESRALFPPYRVWTPTAVAVHKLRQYNRDDGLGVAPRRAYGGASRNNTGRAYGYT